MFYLKLALTNIRKSLVHFGPFMLASLVLFVLLCATKLILLSPVSLTMASGQMTLGLAIVVLTLFASIMAIYSFNILMKQRGREFGLYHMLGMTKKQVALIASLELLMMYVLIVVFGSILSAVFANVIYLIFVKLVQSNSLEFAINPLAFLSTSMTFGAIFAMLLGVASVRIGKSSPLILFRSQEKGEKEPRGNILLAFLALLALAMGYGLSVTSSYVQSSALIIRFFIAVIFVIIGTYLFYISFMTWYLKKRRSQKAYFYQPEHFVATSQMIFRMKQNAVGLANITLLAIMSFVTIATTTSLYTGISSNTNLIFPRNSHLEYIVSSRAEAEEEIQQGVTAKLEQPLTNALTYLTTNIPLPEPNGKVWQITEETLGTPPYPNVLYTYLVTQEDFRQLGNPLEPLAKHQIAVYMPDGQSQLTRLEWLGQSYEVTENLNNILFPSSVASFGASVIVVSDDEVMDQWVTAQNQHTPSEQTDLKPYYYHVFADLTPKQIKQLAPKDNQLTTYESTVMAHILQKTDYETDMFGFIGGFLFTGFLLGLSFLFGAALIIYYKQYSEGNEDKKAYTILQEVGMSTAMIKKTINTQIILVFFMPLAMALVHFGFATVMLRQMLFLFGVTSSNTVYTISGITIALVTSLYYVIYRLTSRTYYRIIER